VRKPRAGIDGDETDEAIGGGFLMGSSYFYLEFLLSWLSVLAESGYRNPAVFALEYTLVPEASFPVQLQETIQGYEHVLTVARDPSIVCVSGDSAGANLILGLLLYLARGGRAGAGAGSWPVNDRALTKPGFAVLISPWTTLISPLHKNTANDYLDDGTLRRFGLQYTGTKVSTDDPLVSPGKCNDVSWWKEASPTKGIFVTYGQEEVLAPEIKELVGIWKNATVRVEADAEIGGIHAWPVASHFLSNSSEQRLKGLRKIVEEIRQQIRPRGEGKV
jgi:acetyl esterase/lipase